MSDRLEEIKCIFDAPGEVFFGSLSKDGVVSQDVCDAEPYFKWLIAEVERLRVENERLDERMKMYEKRAVHLAAVNDQLNDDNNANQALLDRLYLIAPDKIEEAIDAQKESDKQ